MYFRDFVRKMSDSFPRKFPVPVVWTTSVTLPWLQNQQRWLTGLSLGRTHGNYGDGQVALPYIVAMTAEPTKMADGTLVAWTYPWQLRWWTGRITIHVAIVTINDQVLVIYIFEYVAHTNAAVNLHCVSHWLQSFQCTKPFWQHVIKLYCRETYPPSSMDAVTLSYD